MLKFKALQPNSMKFYKGNDVLIIELEPIPIILVFFLFVSRHAMSLFGSKFVHFGANQSLSVRLAMIPGPIGGTKLKNYC